MNRRFHKLNIHSKNVSVYIFCNIKISFLIPSSINYGKINLYKMFIMPCAYYIIYVFNYSILYKCIHDIYLQI